MSCVHILVIILHICLYHIFLIMSDYWSSITIKTSVVDPLLPRPSTWLLYPYCLSFSLILKYVLIPDVPRDVPFDIPSEIPPEIPSEISSDIPYLSDDQWTLVGRGKNKMLKCLDCSYKSRSLFLMKNHYKKNHLDDSASLKCPFCAFTSKCVSLLKTHETKRHSSLLHVTCTGEFFNEIYNWSFIQ